jgi:hypothetical protein
MSDKESLFGKADGPGRDTIPGKRPYRKPELVRYGDVAELTKTGKPHGMRDTVVNFTRTHF